MVKNIQDNQYLEMLKTVIRDKRSDSKLLQDHLFDAGFLMGIKICEERLLHKATIETPMHFTYEELQIKKTCNSVIISTKDDYAFFASGLNRAIKSDYQGYMDFNGVRGKDTFSSPIRSIELPEIKNGLAVENVIIAKSVFATGCTAISLAKKALEKYMPSKLIIVGIFYSVNGVNELQTALPNADIYICGNPDNIDNNGILIPGIGNIDERLKLSCG